MKKAVALLALIIAAGCAGRSRNVTIYPDAGGFEVPAIELQHRISEIFEFRDFECISGLTCKVHYNGKKPLPSEVLYDQYDGKGKLISSKKRLIYPELEKGETGYATFFYLESDVQKVFLYGNWKGPWKDPY